jgi:pilus assembly protein CpaC
MTSAYTTEPRRLRRVMNGRPAATAALAAAIIVILVAAPRAQQPTPAFAANAAPVAPPVGTEMPTDVDLLVGRSTVLNVGAPIARVSLTVPDIADAMVTAPTQLLVHGKQPGTISLFVWDRAGAIKTYEVKVRRDLSPLVGHLKQLFPNETVTVMGSGKDVVISGTVSSKYVIEKAADVAAGYVEKKENVVNLLQQQEGVASNQVMLRVRFAEVSRSAVMELGANFFTGPTGYKDWIARSTTQQFAAPNYTDMSRSADLADNLTSAEGKYSLSDFLNIFVFNNKYNIGTVVRALQEKGLFQSLAEPNLIATNGKEASFLAGGEYPYPVVQGGSNSNTSVTIMFKEFGVRLNFTPTVLGGDLINLKVKPEVSSLDFGNAVTVSGFRVPALSTRRTETEVELRDGQTFAIAGLMNNTVQDSMRKIPGIGDIPILGWLFKSRALQKGQTELVVMITPTIVRRGQPGVSEGLPSLVEPYLGAPPKTHPNPDAYVGSPRYPVTQPRQGADAAAPAAQPATPVAQPATPVAPTAAPVAQPATPAVGTAPVSAPAAQPVNGAVPAPLESRPVTSPEPAPAPEAKPTKEEQKAIEQARELERKAAAAAEKERLEQEKRDAEQQKVTAKSEEKRLAAEKKRADEQAKKDEEARRRAEKIEKERSGREAAETQAREKRDAEAARKAAAAAEEEARRRADEQQKREKALTDAAERLKQAQAEYQSQVEKASTSVGAAKDANTTSGSFAPRR